MGRTALEHHSMSGKGHTGRSQKYPWLCPNRVFETGEAVGDERKVEEVSQTWRIRRGPRSPCI